MIIMGPAAKRVIWIGRKNKRERGRGRENNL